jgi:phage shock protein A
VDADGVALAAIQALYKLSQDKDKQITKLRQEVDELRARLLRLEQGVLNR